MSKDEMLNEQAFNYVIDNNSETLKALERSKNTEEPFVRIRLVDKMTPDYLEDVLCV